MKNKQSGSISPKFFFSDNLGWLWFSKIKVILLQSVGSLNMHTDMNVQVDETFVANKVHPFLGFYPQ